jgi:hypothetical protein
MKYTALHEGQMLREYVKESKIRPGFIFKKAGTCRATLYVWYNTPRLSEDALKRLKKVGIEPEDFLMDKYLAGLVKRIRELEKENALLKKQPTKK